MGAEGMHLYPITYRDRDRHTVAPMCHSPTCLFGSWATASISLKFREGKTWAMAVQRGSRKFPLSSDIRPFFLGIEGNSILNFGSLHILSIAMAQSVSPLNDSQGLSGSDSSLISMLMVMANLSCHSWSTFTHDGVDTVAPPYMLISSIEPGFFLWSSDSWGHPLPHCAIVVAHDP